MNYMETTSVQKAVFASIAVFALVTVLGVSAPQKALADCYDQPECPLSDGYYGGSGGSDWGGYNDGYYDNWGTESNNDGYYGGGYDDWGTLNDGYYEESSYDSWDSGWSGGGYVYDMGYGGCSYGCGGSYYGGYPTYYYNPNYSTPSYNNNQNTNVNNNNVNVNVNGGSTNTVIHSCAEYGQSGTYPNCYVPHTPSCSDSGQVGSYPNCHQRDTGNNNVSCNLDASDTTVSDGDRVTLEWDTDGNVTYASINQGVGRVDENSGSERVTVDGDTTFKMTVRNSQGDEDTCSVTVRVDDNNFSSVSFTGEPTYNPPVVYLSDIPYTGLEDIDPILLSYWLMLLAGAAAGVWFLYRKGMIPQFAFASAEPEADEAEAPAAEDVPLVDGFLSALASGDTDAALDEVRGAAAIGTSVEDFLGAAEAAATDTELQARVSAALEAAKLTGIRGAKAALA